MRYTLHRTRFRKYTLYLNRTSYSRRGVRPYGRYATLAEAMTAAGLPDPATWLSHENLPGRIWAWPAHRTCWEIFSRHAGREAAVLGAEALRQRISP
jgi:hypothetical protein